jgi:signal transduction histidine kinase/DNA-binding response OmpR family regulator
MSGGGERILVVEDSATQAAALALLLEDHGYAPDVARSAERALALLGEAMERAAPYALVLSDVVMPGIDGYELCRRIKAQPWTPGIPVVLLTSLGDPLALVRGLESGADHYVTKPYEPARLLARVRQVIDAPPAERPVGRPIDVSVLGGQFTIAADKEHIVELLVSSYEDLVRTSEAMRAAEQRARFLAEAGELLSSSLDVERVLTEVGRIAVPRVADACLVDVVDAGGHEQRVEVAVADPSREGIASALRAHHERWSDLRPADDAVAIALTDDVLARITEGPEHAGLLRALGARAAMVLPLVSRGTALGRITLLTGPSGRGFTDADRELATELARRAALALDNARLYRAAREATQSRDDMLAIVSHDLRNPLHTIQMSSSFLLDLLTDARGVPPDPSMVEGQVVIMRRAAGRANMLIQDLLDVSRIEAGRLSVQPAPVDGLTFLDEVMTELAPLARAKKVALEFGWQGPTATVPMDRERIAQVMSNLVGNAIKFTPAGGTVTVSGSLVADRAQLTVRDSGPGIPPANLPHLFDRYWQAERGARHGAGLGLFIARGIVEAHGGTIEVESAPGQGAAFHVLIPAR